MQARAAAAGGLVVNGVEQLFVVLLLCSVCKTGRELQQCKQRTPKPLHSGCTVKYSEEHCPYLAVPQFQRNFHFGFHLEAPAFAPSYLTTSSLSNLT